MQRFRRLSFATLAVMKSVIAAALLLPLIAACAATATRPGSNADSPSGLVAVPTQGVRGTLTYQGRPLAGASVLAYRR